VIYNPPDPAAGAKPPDQPATLVLSSAQLSGAHLSTASLRGIQFTAKNDANTLTIECHVTRVPDSGSDTVYCITGVFGIVLAQLRQHLGLPDRSSPPGSCTPGADSPDSSSRPDAVPSRTCAADAPLTAEDVDTLMRRALRSNTAAAGRTLASLARLVKSLPTLAMPDLVGDQVSLA
jgi:Phosphatidylinositol-glycan biosynthesis class S protein